MKGEPRHYIDGWPANGHRLRHRTAPDHAESGQRTNEQEPRSHLPKRGVASVTPLSIGVPVSPFASGETGLAHPGRRFATGNAGIVREQSALFLARVGLAYCAAIVLVLVGYVIAVGVQ